MRIGSRRSHETYNSHFVGISLSPSGVGLVNCVFETTAGCASWNTWWWTGHLVAVDRAEWQENVWAETWPVFLEALFKIAHYLFSAGLGTSSSSPLCVCLSVTPMYSLKTLFDLQLDPCAPGIGETTGLGIWWVTHPGAQLPESNPRLQWSCPSDEGVVTRRSMIEVVLFKVKINTEPSLWIILV